MKYLAVLQEMYRISTASIRANIVRTILTVLIIGFGIMALVGILTAIDSIKGSISSQFATMGANTFTIESRGMDIQIGNQRQRRRNYDYISYRQARDFKARFNMPATISISVHATGMATIRRGSNKTNPNVSVTGTDENYLITAGYEIDKGRFFTEQEIEMNRNFVVIGNELVNKLFESNEPVIGEVISIGNGKFKVIGVLGEKGTAINSSDNVCLLPYTVVRQYFSRPEMNYSISITPRSHTLYEQTVGQAESLFRITRNLHVTDESDFVINKSDNLSKMFIENIKFVTIAATVIGIVTLFGAAIGLMNIMLVSVTERTREIGIRKAIGAKRGFIKQQFLFEAVLICQYGAIIGIILGIIVGNIVSMVLKSPFIVPWKWMIAGLILCTVVGLISGFFPALKASRLDPIVALRYE